MKKRDWIIFVCAFIVNVIFWAATHRDYETWKVLLSSLILTAGFFIVVAVRNFREKRRTNIV